MYTRIARALKGVGAKLCAVSALLIISAACGAYADTPLTMAPPVQATGGDAAVDSSNAAADTVFNWTEVPQNQNVPINRAVFDQGGYQLYDNSGETIVIPFTDNNLYVMKFAISPDGTTYFVNTGDYPVLYMPQDGYLENLAVSGARWFPFTSDFHPDQPVFLGCAPSWNDYVSMGWYPNMACYGGYWSGGPVLRVGVVLPTVGLFFQIGGQHFNGWAPYQGYMAYHPAPYRVTIVNQNIYNWARPTYSGNRSFGGGLPWQNRPAPTYGRTFNGTGRPYSIGGPNGFSGQTAPPQRFQNSQTPNTAGHVFRGGSDTAFGADHSVAAPLNQPATSRQPQVNTWERPEANGAFHGAAPQTSSKASPQQARATFQGPGRSANNDPNSAGRSFQGADQKDDNDNKTQR